MSPITLTAVRRKGRWVARQRGHRIAAVISIDSFVAMSNARRLYGIDVVRSAEFQPDGAA